MTRKKKRMLMGIGRAILLALFLLAVILPIYWMMSTSFKPNQEIINAQKLTYFPHTWTLENYRMLFSMSRCSLAPIGLSRRSGSGSWAETGVRPPVRSARSGKNLLEAA